MDYLDDEKFEEYIKDKTCRGCGNHCLLLEPSCNRSRIFIKDEYEKYIKEIALKEKSQEKLMEMIEKYNLQNEEEIMDHLSNIDNDPIGLSFYPRLNKKKKE